MCLGPIVLGAGAFGGGLLLDKCIITKFCQYLKISVINFTGC